jgi:inosose dehydratase
MKVGCFALIDPFATLDHQLERIAGLGFKYADITDSHPGSSLGRDYGFSATVSLDDNPLDVRRMFEKHGLQVTSVCAHATLLDPVSPARFGTSEIIKAIRLAADMGVQHVITTEGHPQTDWARRLSFDQQILVVVDKLYEPVRLAGDLGVTLLLEPHGPLTDTIEGLQALLDAFGWPEQLGVNMDTGNSWLGGSDPVELARTFCEHIYHVHWKDLPADWEAKRGLMWGCGFGPVALGEGVIDIAGVYEVLKFAPHVEYSTLELGGDENLLKSYAYLKSLGAE